VLGGAGEGSRRFHLHLDEREVCFLFLREVEAQDGVQAVEDASKLGEGVAASMGG
jgi:hypothetical protein